MDESWVGSSRRWAYVRPIVGLMVGFPILQVVFGLGMPRKVSLDDAAVWVGVLETILVVGLVYSVRANRPVTLLATARGISVTQGGESLTASWSDIEWSDSSLDDDTVILELRDDPVTGPRPGIAIDMLSFTSSQREQIVHVLRRHHDGSHAGIVTGHRGRRRLAQRKSWRGRSTIGLRLISWAAGVIVALLVLGAIGAFWGSGSQWVFITLAILASLGMVLAAIRDIGVYGAVTVTIDNDGVCIDRWPRCFAVPFSAVASVTVVPTRDVRGMPSYYLVIEPRADYYVRSGTRPPGWLSSRSRIYQERFKPGEFSEMRSMLRKAVTDAGGQYIKR